MKEESLQEKIGTIENTYKGTMTFVININLMY